MLLRAWLRFDIPQILLSQAKVWFKIQGSVIIPFRLLFVIHHQVVYAAHVVIGEGLLLRVIGKGEERLILFQRTLWPLKMDQCQCIVSQRGDVVRIMHAGQPACNTSGIPRRREGGLAFGITRCWPPFHTGYLFPCEQLRKYRLVSSISMPPEEFLNLTARRGAAGNCGLQSSPDVHKRFLGAGRAVPLKRLSPSGPLGVKTCPRQILLTTGSPGSECPCSCTFR